MLRPKVGPLAHMAQTLGIFSFLIIINLKEFLFIAQFLLYFYAQLAGP
jgi:hypothetical protein